MRTLPSWFGLLGTLALAGLPASAGAQPVGEEFQVNTYTTGRQKTGDSSQFNSAGRVIAAAANGDFVVVWESLRQDGSSYGIFGQRYDSAGDAQGNEFRVNTTTTMSQESPAVASDPEGNYVVVWQSLGQDGSGAGIFAQRYDSGGKAQGAEFRVNSYTNNDQRHPAVSATADGSFVVAWESDAGADEIFARRFDSAGNALGTEFRVNSYTTGDQFAPAVASDPGGNFVVVWYSYDYPPGYGQLGVFGQRYDDAGSPIGAEFRVSHNGAPPSIASDASGNFVVVWYQVGNSNDIWGRRYDSQGVPLTDQFLVNTYTTSNQRYPQVASDDDGNHVVVWQSSGQDGQYGGVFGRRYDNAGVAKGPDFQINSHTTGDQTSPSVGATGINQFVVAWSSLGQVGRSYDVFGQRFDFSGTQTITVVSPNTNVKWRIGSQQKIQWTHNLGADATFRIELDRDDDGNYEELIADAAPVDSATKGSFAWTVTGPRSGTARVRVAWTDDLSVSDASDVTFQIRPVG